MFKRILMFPLFILAACASIQTPPPDSGLEGIVLIGPMCPVVQVGEDCPDQPYQSVLTINSPAGERIIQFQTGVDGSFKIPLLPGEYILHPESPNVMPFAQDQLFTVESGKFTHVVVNYDSGIR